MQNIWKQLLKEGNQYPDRMVGYEGSHGLDAWLLLEYTTGKTQSMVLMPIRTGSRGAGDRTVTETLQYW